MIDDRFIGSLNWSTTAALVGTFVAWYAGEYETIVGGTVSATEPVVNVVDCVATEFPATSCTPLIVILIEVLAGNGSTGVKVTYVFVESNVIDVGTWVGVEP